ncbi:MAG: short-chain dehydrogenase [Spirochaetaceae bacterium]|nr:short-chain dehydrogenase [Spirochaetaceae bacterium]|tara:strand:+ start:44349 stop:45173 length:825 start_codon:yes stop_codon:yes gene_type:complete
MAQFNGKVAIITGASSGVGESCARKFAAEGASTVLVARNKKKLAELQKQIPGSRAFPADISDPKNYDKLIKFVLKEFGAIHILVNNAGVNYRGGVLEVEEDLGKIIDLNLRAPIALTQKVLPHIRASSGGSVVNVASLAGRFPLPHEATYSSSKFGLRAFSLALAQELEGTGITASVVSPGPIETGFILTEIDSVPPLVFSQPMSTADQVADLVLKCARDGKPERTIPVSGGILATLAYLWPGLRRLLKPMLERKGQRIKAKYIEKLRRSGQSS